MTKKRQAKFDVEDFSRYLKQFLPNVMKLFDPTPADISLVFNRFETRYAFYEKQLAVSESFYIENSLVDLIWKAEEGVPFAVDYLAFIEAQCAVIMKNIDPALCREFRSTMKNLFLNFDDNESRIQSYVGELCVLAKLLSSNVYRLLKVEYRLSNGNSIDYLLSDGERQHLVEVSNVDISGWPTPSRDKVVELIWGKAKTKIETKFAGSGVPENMSFMLVQVTWGDLEKLVPYQDVFSKGDLFGSVVAQPMHISRLQNTETNKEVYVFITTEAAIEMSRRRQHGRLS
ncbi:MULTISPECIES: hypothetical protein [Methylomonas]|uniref:Uncharacterized protein n=1 Tax=Methylomonas koyamae TaxID=702114 RepID=A0A177NP26_9GAMM|nr:MULTISPECIES: hypothetical protein [Methylomonas]MDT4332810.1 hypothetical protein [Methylomonas sp. MV1]OAI19807.1 hypothetical protein A1355_03605 [Methylomonas koyamae]